MRARGRARRTTPGRPRAPRPGARQVGPPESVSQRGPRIEIGPSARGYHRPMPEPGDAVPLPHPVRVGAAFWVQRTDSPSLRVALETADTAGAPRAWIDDHLLPDGGDPSDAQPQGCPAPPAAAAGTPRR